MAKDREYLEFFLDDVKNINPGFRALTSSIRGLIRYLEQTVSNAQPLTYEQALGKCADPTHQDVRKYKSAIERLVSVWGKGTFAAYPGEHLKQVEIGRICFRGDGRPPETIFAEGFHKRSRGVKVTYRNFKYDHKSFALPIPKAGDVKPETAVCISPDMSAAALFPLPVDPDVVFAKSWLYLVYVETGYHTHGRMVLDALTGLNEIKDRDNVFKSKASPGINALLYGQEMAADSIPPKSIWAALEVRRFWAERTMKQIPFDPKKIDPKTKMMPLVMHGADFLAGGWYKIYKYTENENADYPPGCRTAVRKFIESIDHDIKTGRKIDLPRPGSGFVPSLGSSGSQQVETYGG